MKPRPQIVIKKGLMREMPPIRLKPRGLERPAGHVSFQKQEILSGISENAVSVPRRRSEIPEVRDYEEQDPEQEERCLRLYQGLETSREVAWARQKGKHQKGHAK